MYLLRPMQVLQIVTGLNVTEGLLLRQPILVAKTTRTFSNNETCFFVLVEGVVSLYLFELFHNNSLSAIYPGRASLGSDDLHIGDKGNSCGVDSAELDLELNSVELGSVLEGPLQFGPV